jgi:hypothetical protein
LGIGDGASIEQPGWTAHERGDLGPVETLVFVPFGEDEYRIGPASGLVGRGHRQPAARSGQTLGLTWLRGFTSKVLADLAGAHLGIDDGELSSLLDQITADLNRRRLARVIGVGLEGEAKNGKSFAAYCAEKSLRLTTYSQ